MDFEDAERSRGISFLQIPSGLRDRELRESCYTVSDALFSDEHQPSLTHKIDSAAELGTRHKQPPRIIVDSSISSSERKEKVNKDKARYNQVLPSSVTQKPDQKNLNPAQSTVSVEKIDIPSKPKTT